MGQYGPQISIAKDLAELVHETAKRVVEFAKKIISSKGRFSMVLSGGSTPRLLYHQLSTHRELDWSKVDFFFGDDESGRCHFLMILQLYDSPEIR